MGGGRFIYFAPLVGLLAQRYWAGRLARGPFLALSLGPAVLLAAILSVQEERVVSNDYTIRFRNRFYQLQPPVYPGERGGRVVVEMRLDGTHLRQAQRQLPPPAQIQQRGVLQVPKRQRNPLEGISADQAEVPAYLYTAKPDNLPYYRAHGYEVTDEVTIPGGAPMWFMERPVPA